MICKQAQGDYDTFISIRQHIIEQLLKKFNEPGFNKLSVLVDGIYVGEPEDLLNHRNGLPTEIWYSTKGLGSKLADVIFIDEHPFDIMFENF